MSEKNAQYFDVVIVGAGPVGLALALELGLRQISVLLAERNDRGGAAPRAKTTNTRTRAHLRRWGIADRLAASSPLGIDYPNTIKFVTALSGFPLTEFRDAFNAAPEKNEQYPEHAQWVPQYTLEKVMLERVCELESVDVRFGTTLLEANQDEGVISTLATQGSSPTSIRSQYLVGADGARSTIREMIGAKMEGQYGIARASNVIFRAPGLTDAHSHGRSPMIIQVQREGISIVGPMDSGDVWYFGSRVSEGEELNADGALAAIRRTTGIDLPYEILSTDVWVASSLLADRYRAGRIFLAGDACHLHPPFGGYGMNMGIGDAVDLGWKIAAQMQGWAGPNLIATYEAERRPIHTKVIEEAVENHKMMIGSPWIDGLDEDSVRGNALRCEVGARLQETKSREYHTLGTVLGLCYENSPIIARETGSVPLQGGQDYHPSAYPGCLAPHGWLADGRSLYDAFGPGFTLLLDDQANTTGVERAISEAAELRVPLEVVRPGARIMARYERNMALVRPDQIVAWRGNDWTKGALSRAIGR